MEQHCTLDMSTLTFGLEYTLFLFLYRFFAAHCTENRTAKPITSCTGVANLQHFTCTEMYTKTTGKKSLLGPISLPSFIHSSTWLYLTCRVHHPPASKQVPSQSYDLIDFPVKRLRHIFRCLGLFLDCTRDMWGGK